jgi:cytochrome oxidase assembly protein ShyY1
MSEASRSWFQDSWKRWLGWLVLATVFAVSCFFLANWQFNRRTEAVAKIDLVTKNYDQPPVSLQELIRPNGFKPSDEWRPTELTGQFLIEDAVLVRNRPYNGSPGFLQVIPFQLTTGQLVAIETGWLATDERLDAPKVIPLPSAEETTIWGRLRPAEPLLGRSAPKGQIPTINLGALEAKTSASGDFYEDFYVRLGESYSSGAVPKTLPMPELTEGNHLSYALQWILFALMSMLALVWGVRQEREFRRIASDPNYIPRKRRKQLGDEDKAVEDALIG